MNLQQVLLSSVCNGGVAAIAPAALRALQHISAVSIPMPAGADRCMSSCSRMCTIHDVQRSTPPLLTTVELAMRLPAAATLTRGFSASACTSAEVSSLPDLVAKVQGFVDLKGAADTAVLSQFAEGAMARAAELTPEQIRNLCVSFAQMGYFNTQFKSVMADTVIEKLSQFTPGMLADTAWAFGEANYYDFDLMANLLPYLKSNIEQFDASSMSKMLWTFGRFGYQDETLMDMMHDIAVKLQANCDSKSLAEVVYAMAQLGWADIRLHNLVAEYAMDNLQDFDAAGLAKLAYGLAAVGYDDDALYTAITTAAASNLDSMSPAEVSMMLWACGEQGHLCDKFMSAVVNEYLPANMTSFSPQQLQTAVRAWNKLGYTNPAVAQAANRLDEILPHLVPDEPQAVPTVQSSGS